jgi:hypothetical protein
MIKQGFLKENDLKPKQVKEKEVKEPIPKEPTPLMPVVNQFMNNIISKKAKTLSTEKIEPFSPECKYGKNGLILFIGKQGSGKSFKIMQTLLYTEMMNEQPYFNNVLFCSTSNENDKTVDTFKKHVKTKIEYVNTENLMTRLQKHIEHKKKLNAIMEYINSKGNVINPLMEKLAEKHDLSNTYKTARYFQHKLTRYGNPNYPAYTALILDDCLGNKQLENKNSPIVQMLTKCRHNNITCFLSQQSIRGIGKTIRRLASDCTLWSRFGRDDFLALTSELNLSVSPKDLYDIYKKLDGPHSCMHFHNHLDEIEAEVID